MSWLAILFAALGDRIVLAARSQIGITVSYDRTYRVLKYPNGDVPRSTGVCTDVVIRALRTAQQFDLQQAVHEDMARHFSAYPHTWGLSKPDKNIDHRRVPNLQIFFRRKGWQVQDDYRPGDIVTCLLPKHLPHIMIVSDRWATPNRRSVIHNIGAGVREEDALAAFQITGHFRIRNLAQKCQIRSNVRQSAQL